MRKFPNLIAVVLAALVWLSLPVQSTAQAQQAQQQTSQQPQYTMQEYNSFQACQSEKDPQAKTNCLDEYMSKYPNSTLNKYVGQLYVQACGQFAQAKQYPKAITCADHVISLGDKTDVTSRLQAIQVRIQAFSAAPPTGADASAQLTQERDDALLGAQLLPKLPKPDNVTDAQFEEQKKPAASFFEGAAGMADSQLKDYPDAITAYKAVLANSPNDPVTEYRLGLAYLALTPPQSLDGFWALARAVDLKITDADKVKDYLRKTIINYEQPNCDTLVDGQLNELLQLAANAPDRPATYTIPAAADLVKIAQASTIVTVISDLGAGGDKAKMTWLAICGAEFPEVVGKIIDVQKTDNAADFMVYFGATQEDVEAATTANMDVKVYTAAPTGAAAADETPQPDVLRLQKDDPIRFAGTLVSYDPTPLMLHWDKVKVDPTIIPDKGGAPKHAPAKKPATKPGN